SPLGKCQIIAFFSQVEQCFAVADQNRLYRMPVYFVIQRHVGAVARSDDESCLDFACAWNKGVSFDGASRLVGLSLGKLLLHRFIQLLSIVLRLATCSSTCVRHFSGSSL